MSRTLLVFTGHKVAYKCVQQCCASYLCKNISKERNIHSTAKYCISIKEDSACVIKVKNFKLEDVENTNSLSTSIISRKIEERNINEEPNVVYEKEGTSRFTSNKTFKKGLERLYQLPKNSLLDIYKTVSHQLNNQTLLTSSCRQNPASQLWEFTYDVEWPKPMSFKGIGKTKAAANKNAALKCLEWLEINRKLKDGKPVIYTSEQIKDMRFKPYELSVAPEILDSMENLIVTYNTKLDIASDSPSFLYNEYTTMTSFDAFGHSSTNSENINFRNRLLRSRLAERRVSSVGLPIFKFRDEILSKLESNRVLLIEGDTGCGKSTQVPQFILDSYTYNGNATDCNILVSQPRKISAISLADRVANEREEIVSDVVGYQVRLENQTPQELGRILYCTTGILLRKLQCTPGLQGCSHVILDEAHERSIDTDMLLLLLKRALDHNPNLKLLIMSATINTHLFKEYFDCPVVKVPGRLYPVEVNFLEDIQKLENFTKYEPYLYRSRHDNELKEEITVDYIKIVQLINWICANKPNLT